MRHAMELHELDLNLLIVLDRLLVERRVSRVAEQLGLTQPAISNALARLRRRFGDELFLRTPRGMEPTPFAESLREPLRAALALLHDGLNQQVRFDPATSRQAFTIGMTDIGEIHFLPSLLERLRRDAPGVSLSTVRDTGSSLRQEMESGRVDLAIGLLPQLQAGFYQQRLFTQRYVCLMRRGHRLDRRRITRADFCAAEHLVVVSAGTGHGKVDEILQRGGVERQVRLTVPHYTSIGPLLQRSDLISTVPERLAEGLLQPFGLASHAHPVRLPDIEIRSFWHARAHRSPASRWLRGLVAEMFSAGAGADQDGPATR